MKDHHNAEQASKFFGDEFLFGSLGLDKPKFGLDKLKLKYKFTSLCDFKLSAEYERLLSEHLPNLGESISELVNELPSTRSIQILSEFGHDFIYEITEYSISSGQDFIIIEAMKILANFGVSALWAVPKLSRALTRDNHFVTRLEVLEALAKTGYPDEKDAIMIEYRLIGSAEERFSLGAINTLKYIYSDSDFYEVFRIRAFEALRWIRAEKTEVYLGEKLSNYVYYKPSDIEPSAGEKLEMLVPGVTKIDRNIRILKEFAEIGEAYEFKGARSLRSVTTTLANYSLPKLQKSFNNIHELLNPVGIIFRRSFHGKRESISGLTEEGRMAWLLVCEFFNDNTNITE